MIETMEEAGLRWKGVPDYPKGLLTEYGWEAARAQMEEEGLNSGRWSTQWGILVVAAYAKINLVIQYR